MTVYNNGYSGKYIGFWKDSMFHGYGRLSYSTGDMREGIFECDNLKEDIKEIKTFDPKSDMIA